MKRVVNKLENSKVEVLCDVETKVWKDAQEKAMKKLLKEVEIKGFRKGQAPEQMARKHVDPSKVLNEAINSLLQPAFDEVLKEEKLQPFAQPRVDVTKVSDTDLQLKFIIVLQPEVTLGAYKGFDLSREKVSVSEKEIDAEIEKILAQNASLVVSDKPAKMGDTVVIDFTGSVDGKEFEGGKAENYSLELGSGQFIPGFEDQLVGAKAESEVDVKVKFPEQYVAELAGKDAIFKVKVHEVKSKVIPELNEDLIKELNIPEVKDVEGLRKHQKAHIAAHKEEHATGHLLDQIIAKVVEGAKIELAEEIVEEEIEGMKKNLENQMSQRGLTMEQYLQITGLTEKTLHDQLKADAEKNLRAILCMEKIAVLENISVSEKDVEDEFAKIAAQYNMPVEQVKEILGKDIRRFVSDLRSRRIQNFLLEANEKKAPAKKEAAAPKEEAKPAAAKKPAAKKAPAKKAPAKK